MIITDKYELGHTLGFGAFSEVKIGTDKTSGTKYAIKIIDKCKCKGKEGMIDTEVNILKKVKHENIIQLYDMYELDNKIYLIMELVTGGELFDDIVSRGKYNEKETAKITQRILLAVDYLHQNGIVHRDLKPENLLLSEKSKNAKVMISDFGLSKLYNEETAMKTACGTPGYVAPEVLRRQGYGREVDLWSIGVITYILLSGYPPFYDANNVELFKKIMAGKYEFDSPWWDNISDKAKDFIRHLLVLDPRARYTAQQALNHPFITQYCGYTETASEPLRSATLTSDASSKGSLNEAAPGRPIGNKIPIDDSGCVTSNEKINQKVYPKEKAYGEKTGSGEKLSKKGGIFGQWFKGKSANKIQS